MKGPLLGSGAEIKGIPFGPDIPVPDMLRHLKAGSLDTFEKGPRSSEILLGSGLAEQIGVRLHSPVTIISYQGQLTPVGVVPTLFHFRVAGIFQSGLYEIDAKWAFVSLRAAQRILDLS